MLDSCNQVVQDARQIEARYLDLDLSDVLLTRYSGLPFYRFDAIEVASADCRQIMRPAMQWVYDLNMSACMRQLPASCASTFPRP
jgi:hypothetical protein